jgi:hypothetical protein
MIEFWFVRDRREPMLAGRLELVSALTLATMACSSSKLVISARDSGTAPPDLGSEVPADTGRDAPGPGQDTAGPDIAIVNRDAGPDGSVDRKEVAPDLAAKDAVADLGKAVLPDGGEVQGCPGTVVLGAFPLMDVGGELAATDDLNGDGMLDVVTTTGSVLLGKGNGTFSGAGIAAANLTRAGVLGDVNGDGKPDLVVSDPVTSVVSVLLGKGDGTFEGKGDFATGLEPTSVALADVSGDGKPDLVTANFKASTVSVLLGKGDGTFAAHADYDTGKGPVAVALGDLNGDQRPDIVVVNFTASTLSVLLDRGDGTFAARQDYPIDTNPR